MNGVRIQSIIMDSNRAMGRTIGEGARVSVNNVAKCAKLGDAVWAKMRVIGETDEQAPYKAIGEYADILGDKSWKGIDVMADRIVLRYYRTHSPAGSGGSGRKDDSEEGGPEGSGEGDSGSGQGDGDSGSSEDSGDGSGQEDGSGQDGDGSEGSGESEGSEGDPEQDGDGSEGDGDGSEGEGSEGEGSEGDGDGDGSEGDGEDEESEDGEESEGESEDGDGEESEGDPEQVPEEEESGQEAEDPGRPKEYVFPDGWIPPADFDLIMEAVNMGMNVALFGPAGCGKSDVMMHVAQAKGVQCYITTAPQMPYDLTGFVDGHGVYTETAFSIPFTKGGIAGIDEIDRGSPEALIAVNAPIANGTMFIPKIGQVSKHPDCIFMATLNTAGLGADLEYVTANQLDASTRDRFVWFRMDYDERIDMAIAKGDRYLVDFARDWRAACDKAGVTNAIFSYRVLKDFKKLCDHPRFGVTKAIEKVLLKESTPKETCLTISRFFSRNNRYHKAFKEYVSTMEVTQ